MKKYFLFFLFFVSLISVQAQEMDQLKTEGTSTCEALLDGRYFQPNIPAQ